MIRRCPRDHAPLRDKTFVASPVHECGTWHGLSTPAQSIESLVTPRTRARLYASPPAEGPPRDHLPDGWGDADVDLD